MRATKKQNINKLKSVMQLEFDKNSIEQYTDAQLGSIWTALIDKCKRGDVSAIKLFFEQKSKSSEGADNGQLEKILKALSEGK